MSNVTEALCNELGESGPDISQGRAFQQQMPIITQGACMGQSANTPMPRQPQKGALLNGQNVRNHTNSEESLQLDSAQWNVQHVSNKQWLVSLGWVTSWALKNSILRYCYQQVAYDIAMWPIFKGWVAPWQLSWKLRMLLFSMESSLTT